MKGAKVEKSWARTWSSFRHLLFPLVLLEDQIVPFLPPATSGGPTPSITLTGQSGSMRTFSPTSDLARHLLPMAAHAGSYPPLLSPKHHLSRVLRGTRGTRCQRSQPQPVSQSTKSQSLLQSCFHLVGRRLNSELWRTTLSSDPLKTR